MATVSSTTSTVPDLDFNFDEAIPATRRGGGVGRPATEWEVALDPARKNPGKSAKIFEFGDTTETGSLRTGQSKATAKSTVINARLRKVCPMEEWKFNTRKLPNGNVGLWVTFVRTMTPEQAKEYERKRQERADAIRAGRKRNEEAQQAAQAANAQAASKHPSNIASGDSSAPSASVTPAEKVAAARAAKVATPQAS